MPIRPPALDDRNFDDLVAELLARIPAHAPEWTNPQVGDPGRSLIELFAWLGDALLYRANLIPERQRLAFLRLLGQPLQPARPAFGLVAFALKDKKPPAAFSLQTGIAFPGPPPFESKAEITVLPVTAQPYYKLPVARETLAQGLEQALAEIHGLGGVLNPYTTTPLFADGPESDGFDVITQTADQCLWFALLAPTAQSPDLQPSTNAATLGALNRPAGGGQLLNIGFVPALPSPDPLAPVSDRAAIPHLWEITANTTGVTITPDQKWVPEYLALDQFSDTTNGLTQQGVVRLTLPSASLIHAPTNDLLADPNAGVGDRPPRLDEDAVASRLVAWVRLRPQPAAAAAATPPQFNQPPQGVTLQGPDGLTAAPLTSDALNHIRLSWAGVNAVEIEQLSTLTNQVFATSDGTADQVLQLPATSVEPETLNLQVEEETGWVQWNRVDDISALDRDSNASRDARVFQLDSEAGTVQLGDGVRGRIPGAGQRIRFTQLRAGGGVAGNLPVGALSKFNATTQDGDTRGPSDNLGLYQPLALAGGADAETLDEAEIRIPARLGHNERAVTASDYQAIALEAPGVSVARAEVLPLFKPQQRLSNVPGVVSVMALPDAPLAPAPNPRADRPFLEAVHAYLDARRPLATELYVIGCEYVGLGLSIAISVAEDFQPDTTLQAVKDAMRQVLWPLPGGGLQGNGWPLGRTVSSRELAVQVARVNGVDEVNGLNLFQRINNAWQPIGTPGSAAEQDLILEAWQLPELLSVVAVADQSAPAKLASDPAPVPDNSAAVPVVPDIC